MSEETLQSFLPILEKILQVLSLLYSVEQSTLRISTLVKAVKDYSYMDQAPIQDVDLAQSIANTLSMFGSRLGNVRVETEFDPELPEISAYGSELNQVWTVLIENALDAMPGGGVLKLKTKLQGQMASVEIWDSGAGIREDLQTRIFEPFFTTKAPGKGLGLGLDTANRIATKHSGFLRAECSERGTCFQVRLPLDQAQAY